MPNCDRCGDELEEPQDKNSAGWWRDKCFDCIQDLAFSPEEDQ